MGAIPSIFPDRQCGLEIVKKDHLLYDAINSNRRIGYIGRFWFTPATHWMIFSVSKAMGVHVRAITVNMAADPKLDALYGAARHIVITDARELPDRLPAIYSRLTKT